MSDTLVATARPAVDRLETAIFEAVGQASRIRRLDGTYDDVLEEKIAQRLAYTVRAEIYAQLQSDLEHNIPEATVTPSNLRAMLRFMERRARRSALKLSR